MRNIRMIAAAAGVCGLLAAPAAVASAQQQSATEVINKLQSEGYTVTIDRIGTGPIEDCVVTNVRNPQQFGQLVPYIGPGARGQQFLVPQVTSQPVSVSLDCSR
ncbi:hypothetical protein [Mycolicibacterium rutilum]|nr:hypothetical protein [Mycolicibacterium rutilum]